MINQKVENKGSYSKDAESKGVLGAEESVFIHTEENRGKLESKKKLKKVRSIRLARLSSIRSSSTRERKPQYDNLSILSSVEVADASPNYMKSTSSSHAKDSFQSTQRLLTKKILTRMSTVKLKRSLTRKLSGRTEPKRILKSSRSIKFAIVKGPKSTRNLSESIHGSDGQNRNNVNDDGNKSQRVITRRLSLKPVRILTRMPTFKPKNSSSQSQASSLHKATCSSTLKDSHFPDHSDLPQEGVSAIKVCTYSYCSLHGHHHHGNFPPLKRFVSMRRRQLKTQKSMKMDGRSKQIGNNARKATQKTKTVHSEDGSSHFQNVKRPPARDSAFKPRDTPTSTVTEGKNMEPDYEELQKGFVQEEPKPASTTDVAYGMQKRDRKYIKMWHLMYKNAVLSNTGKCENKLPFDGKDKEEREQDALAFNGVINSTSCHSYCETDQDIDDAKNNVVELVQKAFDEILLPEAEDLSSDDHFKSRGNGLDEALLEKREERNASTFNEFSGEAQRMETKPDQRTPKSWSHLKKLILLKRFVKALEKVRNINLRRPRQLPPDANFEAEKVFLKHQTAEEKKKAEEWMLDYALQKVISKLVPAQRQRVTLLVEAFETILPFQDAEHGPQSSVKVEPQANPIQSLDASLDHSKEETDAGRNCVYSAKTLLGKASFSRNSTTEFSDNAGDNQMPEVGNPIELKERCHDYLGTKTVKNMPASSGSVEENLNAKLSLASRYNNGEKISIDNDSIYHVEIEDSKSNREPVETISSCDGEAPTNQIVNEVPQDLTSYLKTENPNIKPESPGRYCETKNVIGDDREQFSVSKSLLQNGLVRSLRSNLVGLEAPSNQLDELMVYREEMTEKAKLETGTREEFPTHQQSEAPISAAVEPETQQEKQNYTGLWYLVYKHMVSDTTENNSKPLTDGEDEKESRYEGSITRGTSVSYESTPLSNQDMHLKDHVVADREVELRQIEAIKMVEEAIDSILPDVQDHLPDNSSIQVDRTERMYSEGLNQKEERMESGNGTAQEQEQESVTKEGNKPNKQLSRSWSNLKKVILLRRFIKALEKVRKFNPRGPRYLPIETDPEAEKVQLRHQDMAERRGTEEWMLDYALRQVVSKLTPARKRKVELLVEAFETVGPTKKN